MTTARVALARRLPALLEEIRACQACRAHLPLGPRPILRASATARLLIVGQAPGAKVHATGVAWNDPSGDRLRGWLGLDRGTFDDEARVAIVPMGFCYPGRGESGDQPPRPECAPLWHPRLLALLPEVRLTLLIGAYAQARYLPRRPGSSLTEAVRSFEEAPPGFFPLPHPSPRNVLWRRRNPWFEREVLPVLRRRVEKALAAP